MTFKRETIAIAGAIVGANLIGILTYSKAANSSGLCDNFSQMWSGVSKPAEPARGEPIGHYFDVRTKRDEPYYREGEAPAKPPISQNDQDTGRVQAPPQHRPLTTPYPPQPSTGTQALPPPPGAFTPISYSTLLGGESDSSYQSRRRAIASQMEGY